ncbi:MAG TPA: ribosome-associated translation inhibitor RaiA, partial [Rhodospirillaceae bacterium]|nr:ribosome-associated translation inhibitor RaiA [Rhodospirillaceae bacterium]
MLPLDLLSFCLSFCLRQLYAAHPKTLVITFNFSGLFMQLSVKGKQIDVGDALRQHVDLQLGEIVGKFFSDSLEAQVTFSREAHLFRTDITVHAGRGLVLQSSGRAPEPYPSFDQAAEHMAERLRRHRNRLKKHHQDARREEAISAQSFVLNVPEKDMDEGEADNPVVVAEMTTPISYLTVSEAVMRLDLGELPALMFHNLAHGG